MYRIESGVFIHFSHHVRGHSGPCISLHGHTWKFVLVLGASVLDDQGFVLDFDLLKTRVFSPCHRLLDHSLALGEPSWRENRELITALGENLVASRQATLGNEGNRPPVLAGDLAGARNELPGGIKVAVFPFTPTSERLAEWFHELAASRLGDGRVNVLAARVYESMHPVEMFAEYTPG